jgi:hypothetical protein
METPKDFATIPFRVERNVGEAKVTLKTPKTSKDLQKRNNSTLKVG